MAALPPDHPDTLPDRYRLNALLEALDTGVLFLDAQRRVVYCNHAFLRLWGLPADADLVGAGDAEITERTAWLRIDDAAYREHLRRTVPTPGTSEPYEIRLRNGCLLRETSRSICGPAETACGRLWLFDDITAQRAAETKLVELAERDPLTGLYNRRRFESELDRLLADASRRGTQLGLLMFDLDAFKPVNDRHGHKAGDEVLVRLAQEVGSVVRRNEQFFRIGGDEFALIVPEARDNELIGLARRILTRIDETVFHFDGEEVRVSASLGVAVFPLHALNAAALVQCADTAMYRVKEGGRHGWGLYEPGA